MTRFTPYKYYFCVVSILTGILCLPGKASPAITSGEILVIANRNLKTSIVLAQYYMKKRDIPAKNLLELDLPQQETCSRMVYDRDIAAPIRHYLDITYPKYYIRSVLLMYGVPLKVAPLESSDDERAQIKTLQDQKLGIERQLAGLSESETDRRKSLQKDLRRIKLQVENSKYRPVGISGLRTCAGAQRTLSAFRLATESIFPEK